MELGSRRRVVKQRSVFVTRRHPPAASRVRGDGRPRASGRPRIDIARDLGLRARFAGHLPTSTPRARVYITRHPPPRTDTPPQITAYKANFIGTCMQYAQGASRIAPQTLRPADCFDIRPGSVFSTAYLSPLHIES